MGEAAVILRLPLLGVLLGVQTPKPLRSLLVAMSDRCRPVTCSAIEATPHPPPVAYLWCGSTTPPPADVPYGAWVCEPGDLTGPIADNATVLLCETWQLAESAGARGLMIPPQQWNRETQPMLPFIRRRLRQVRGLGETTLATGNESGWNWDQDPELLPEDLVDTAAGSAAAVIATGPALGVSLGWAAPTVTDPGSAAAIGAIDGTHVLVAPDHDRRVKLASDLAKNEALSARLSWAGWLLHRSQTDVKFAADEVLRRLGIAAHPVAGMLATLEDQFDVLGTPPDAHARWRLQSLVASLPGHPHPEGD